jgi:type I restriction enzyme S subunit
VLQANERADTRYLAYALARAEIGGYLSGSTMPKLTQANLHRIPVPAPPLAEQRRIAGILGALDDKMELNLRASETLEGTALALFKSWFLDSELDASDQDGTLADAVDLLRDTVDPQLEPDTVFQHHSLPSYDAGREATTEPGAGIRSSKLAVPRGSVLLSKLNPEIERVWLPDIRPDDRAICSTEFLVLRPRPDIGSAFVYEFLRSAPFRSTLTSLVTGTTGSHQRAHAEAILQVPLRLPGPSRAAKFELLVGPVLDRTAVARRESRTLVALRDALLPRLLSGETSPSFGRGHGT